MSRSYKKAIIQAAASKKLKKVANQKVRKTDVQNGKSYKKVFSSWDICDYLMDMRFEHTWDLRRSPYQVKKEDTRAQRKIWK